MHNFCQIFNQIWLIIWYYVAHLEMYCFIFFLFSLSERLCFVFAKQDLTQKLRFFNSRIMSNTVHHWKCVVLCYVPNLFLVYHWNCRYNPYSRSHSSMICAPSLWQYTKWISNEVCVQAGVGYWVMANGLQALTWYFQRNSEFSGLLGFGPFYLRL